MNKSIHFQVAIFAALFLQLTFTQTTWAAEFRATASTVSGDVNYVSVKDKATHPLEVGHILIAGDQVVTGSDGSAEITFEDSGAMTLDKDTKVTIRTIGRKPSGVIESIFYLAIGRIKSTLSKQMVADKFEYHTKAAIAGVAGTPPHIIEASKNEAGKATANVYLLGEAGDEGSLYVRGFDKKKTTVTLFAGQGTSIVSKLAPLAPFLLTPHILEGLAALSSSGGSGGGGVMAALKGSTDVGGTSIPNSYLVGGAAAVGAGAYVLSGDDVITINEETTGSASGGYARGPQDKVIDVSSKLGGAKVTSVEITLTYEAYSVPDQFQIIYEGNTIFDSGNISGSSTVTKSASGSSPKITVRVLTRRSGTAWNWRASTKWKAKK